MKKAASKTPAANLDWADVHNKGLILAFLLYYLSNTSRCRYSASTTVNETVHRQLVAFGLVEKVIEEDEDVLSHEEWNITTKGRVFAQHLLSQPLPEQSTTWSMPGQKD